VAGSLVVCAANGLNCNDSEEDVSGRRRRRNGIFGRRRVIQMEEQNGERAEKHFPVETNKLEKRKAEGYKLYVEV